MPFTKYILFFFLIFIVGCKKEEEPLPIPVIDTTIISNTSNDGKLISLDNSDWQLSDSLSNKEKSLFNFSDTLNYSLIKENFTLVINPVYPNPTSGSVNLKLNTNSPVIYKVVIVDEFLNRKTSFTMEASEGLSYTNFNFSTLGNLVKGRNYRMYYEFYSNKKKVIFAGHGDFFNFINKGINNKNINPFFNLNIN